jgi:hypothetical protein
MFHWGCRLLLTVRCLLCAPRRRFVLVAQNLCRCSLLTQFDYTVTGNGCVPHNWLPFVKKGCLVPFCRLVTWYMALQIYFSAICILLTTHLHAFDNVKSFTSNTNACVLVSFTLIGWKICVLKFPYA